MCLIRVTVVGLVEIEEAPPINRGGSPHNRPRVCFRPLSILFRSVLRIFVINPSMIFNPFRTAVLF